MSICLCDSRERKTVNAIKLCTQGGHQMLDFSYVLSFFEGAEATGKRTIQMAFNKKIKGQNEHNFLATKHIGFKIFYLFKYCFSLHLLDFDRGRQSYNTAMKYVFRPNNNQLSTIYQGVHITYFSFILLNQVQALHKHRNR